MKNIFIMVFIGLSVSCQKPAELMKHFPTNASDLNSLNQSTPVRIEHPVLQKLTNGIVYLEYNAFDQGGSDKSSCNGIIIAPFKILTAAHCFYNLKTLMDKEQPPSTEQLIIQYGDVTAHSPLMKQISGQQIASIEVHKDFFSNIKLKKNSSASLIAKAIFNGADQALITLSSNDLLNTIHYDQFKAVPNHYVVDNGMIDKKNVDNFKYAVLLAYTFYTNIAKGTILEKASLYYSVGLLPLPITELSPTQPGVIVSDIIFNRDHSFSIATCTGDSGSPLFYQLKNPDKLLLVGILSGGIHSTYSGPNCAFKSIYSLILNNRSWLNY